MGIDRTGRHLLTATYHSGLQITNRHVRVSYGINDTDVAVASYSPYVLKHAAYEQPVPLSIETQMQCSTRRMCHDCRLYAGTRQKMMGVLEFDCPEGYTADDMSPKNIPLPLFDSTGEQPMFQISNLILESTAAKMPKPDAFKKDVLANATMQKDGYVWIMPELYRTLKKRHEGSLSSIEEAKRSKPKVKQALTLFQAMTTAGRVSDEIRRERQVKCASCDKVRRDGVKQFCDLCGCGNGGGTANVINLTTYNEGPIQQVTVGGKKVPRPKWGCKHPQRGQKRVDGTTCGWDR